MKRVCAWCQRLLNNEPENGELISHGICEYCAKTLYNGKNSAGMGNGADFQAALQVDAGRQMQKPFWWIELLKLPNRLRE